MYTVAIHHRFPGLAEEESAARLRRAATTLGWRAEVFTDGLEMEAFAPDFVIALSYHEGKVSTRPTYGVIMAPRAWMEGNAETIASILSYDGYLTLSAPLRHWLLELNTAFGRTDVPIGRFANTFPATDASPPPATPSHLAYVGTNWDGLRNWPLFDMLARRPDMRFHGSPEAWRHLPPGAYGGPIPFDGISIATAYAQAGIGLGLDRPDFLADDLPSNRVFEIPASGAVGILGTLPFTKDTFGDSVLYIDQTAPPEVIAWQVARHMDWIARHPDDAMDMARRAHVIFNHDLALERLFVNVAAMHEGLVHAPVQPRRDSRAFAEEWARHHATTAQGGLCFEEVRTDAAAAPLPTGAAKGQLDLYVVDRGAAPAAVIRLADGNSPPVPPAVWQSGAGLWHARLALAAQRLWPVVECPGEQLVAARLRLDIPLSRHTLTQLGLGGRVWIYGTGEGGRRTASHLPHPPAGFIDDFAAGTELNGRPVLSLTAAAALITAQDSLILANQHWARLWRQCQDVVGCRLYTTHPEYGGTATFLG